jgi:quercetin dioxygenase-like cupin family protein
LLAWKELPMKIFLVLALLVATPALSATSASAPQMTARVVLNATTTATGQAIRLPQGSVRVIGSIVEIAPGYAPGYHEHLYSRYAYVLAGHLDVQDEGGTTRHYAPGDFFVETIHGWHRPHVVGDETVKLLVIDQQPADAKTNTVNR